MIEPREFGRIGPPLVPCEGCQADVALVVQTNLGQLCRGCFEAGGPRRARLGLRGIPLDSGR